MMSVLSGCATGGLSDAPYLGACDTFQPIPITPGLLPKDQEDDVIVHNKSFACLCDEQLKKSEECKRFRVGM